MSSEAALPPRRTAAVLAIGDELALGQMVDTNSAWIADSLAARGVRVVEHATVDDEERRIAAAMERLGGACDLLIATGGLGPTADDLTRFALARVLGGGPSAGRVELIEDDAAMEKIRAWFSGRAGGVPAGNRVQAMRPDGAACILNDNGTAPGLHAFIERLGCEVFCLPGPPREMIAMFDSDVLPSLRSDGGRHHGVRLLLTFGLGESAVAERLGERMDRDRPARGLPLIGTTASRGVVTCRVRHEADSAEQLRAALDDAESQVRAALGPAVFARRDPASGDGLDIADALPRAVLELLRERGEMLAVVESCTGGMLGEMLTDVPGSSDGFFGGWLTYSNGAKAAMAGVTERSLVDHGAVSREVSLEMARGGFERARGIERGVGHVIAITGVAGPGGGSEEKPVGTVWIARASEGSEEARKFGFKGGRAAVREWSARAALGMLRLHLIGEAMPLLGQREPDPTPIH